jgi:biofilm protein TabA
MILDHLKNADAYRSLGPRIAQAFDYLIRTRFADTPSGRYEVDGADVYAMVNRYQPGPIKEAKWEAHCRYIDVQYMVEGSELVGYAPLSERLPVTNAYDAEKDSAFFDARGDFFRLNAGSFAIFMPQDVHAPSLAIADEPSRQVCKVVVKCRVD